MRLLTLLLGFLLLGSVSCHSPSFDHDFEPYVEMDTVVEIPSLVNSTISPVFRLRGVQCDPSAKFKNLGNGSLVFVSDSSDALGTPHAPFVYIFLTANHVLESEVEIHTGFFSTKTVQVEWELDYWLYGPRGHTKERKTLSLCPDKSDSSFFVWRSDKYDIAFLVVFTQEKLEGVHPATVAPPEIVDDLKIGQAVYICGCQGGDGSLLREGIISSKEKTAMWSSAPANPGDSGGGVFDTSGRLIGIIAWKPSGDGTGCGFIPLNLLYDELLGAKMIRPIEQIWR